MNNEQLSPHPNAVRSSSELVHRWRVSMDTGTQRQRRERLSPACSYRSPLSDRITWLSNLCRSRTTDSLQVIGCTFTSVYLLLAVFVHNELLSYTIDVIISVRRTTDWLFSLLRSKLVLFTPWRIDPSRDGVAAFQLPFRWIKSSREGSGLRNSLFVYFLETLLPFVSVWTANQNYEYLYLLFE